METLSTATVTAATATAPTKRELRNRFGWRRGAIQISAHGCNRFSAQLFVNGKLVDDRNL